MTFVPAPSLRMQSSSALMFSGQAIERPQEAFCPAESSAETLPILEGAGQIWGASFIPRVITVAVKIKFQKGVVDTFFDIFGIFQTGRGCLPHKGSILFHELFRSGKS